MPTLDVTLGEVLRTVRNRKRLSLRELAAKSGIPASMLSYYERDRCVPPFNRLQHICKALNLSINDLQDEGE